MAISFKGAHFPHDIILMGVRWYVAYPLSTRHVEELMLERGVHVDHSTINRWVVKYSPLLEEAFHRRKRPVWISWRMDETYIKGLCRKFCSGSHEGAVAPVWVGITRPESRTIRPQ
jgi:transposase-like protein